MPSDAKKKREQKKKEAAKAKQVNKKTEEKEEVNTGIFLYPDHNKIFTWVLKIVLQLRLVGYMYSNALFECTVFIFW